MNRPFRLLFVLLLSLFLLSACWDSRDINHRSLPVMLGISYEEEHYHVILSIPTSLQENKRDVQIVKGDAPTLSKALDMVRINLENSMDLLHLEVIVFDIETARNGLEAPLNTFMRVRDISTTAALVLCDEDLTDFFNNTAESFKKTGSPLFTFFAKNSGWNPYQALTPVWKAFRGVHSDTMDVALPIVHSSTNTSLVNKSTAIFRRGTMVGEMSLDETLLYNLFIGNETSRGRVQLNNNTSVAIQDFSINKTSSLEENKPSFSASLHFQIILIEMNKQNTTDEEIKLSFNKTMEERLKQMIARFQVERADPLHLGQNFRQYYSSEELTNWRDEIYPTFEADIEVSSTLLHNGKLKEDVPK